MPFLDLVPEQHYYRGDENTQLDDGCTLVDPHRPPQLNCAHCRCRNGCVCSSSRATPVSDAVDTSGTAEGHDTYCGGPVVYALAVVQPGDDTVVVKCGCGCECELYAAEMDSWNDSVADANDVVHEFEESPNLGDSMEVQRGSACGSPFVCIARDAESPSRTMSDSDVLAPLSSSDYLGHIGQGMVGTPEGGMDGVFAYEVPDVVREMALYMDYVYDELTAFDELQQATMYD